MPVVDASPESLDDARRRAALDLEVVAFGDDDLEDVAAQLAAYSRTVRGPGDDAEHDSARALVKGWADAVRRLRRDGRVVATPVGASQRFDPNDRARRVSKALDRIYALGEGERTPKALTFIVLEEIGSKNVDARSLSAPRAHAGPMFSRQRAAESAVKKALLDGSDPEDLLRAALTGFGIENAKDWTKRGRQHRKRRGRQASGT